MSSALITGGAGFIGSHLAERLLDLGWKVHVLDDLSTGYIGNLHGIRDCENLDVTIDGIENEPVLRELVDRSDVIFHLAAAVGVKLIVDDPVKTIETNIRGTEKLMEYCAVKGKKVVLASTSEVYGKGSRKKFSEEDDLVFGPTTRSRWSYGCSKAIDEFLALAYYRTHRLPIIILRLFNTVGPRQVGRYGMVVPRFVEQALEGKPITVYGDGKQIRCFTHVADVIDAMCKLVEHEGAVGEIFNVGSGQPTTIRELAELVRRLVNPEVDIQHVPYEKAYGPGFEDIRMRVPDVKKIKGAINFQATKSLDDIIMDVKSHLCENQ